MRAQPLDLPGRRGRPLVARLAGVRPLPLADHLGNIFDAADTDEKLRLVRSEESFNLWQSILRGSGVVTGCRRCQDVCPVGADYQTMLEDALDEIPEATADKQARLDAMAEAEGQGEWPERYRAQARWIGRLRPPE